MTTPTVPRDLQRYADQPDWRRLQEFLPERLRLIRTQDLPLEEFWHWRGNAVHLDRYANPDAPARVILLHGVGTNGRQMTLILGRTLAERGWDVTAIDNLGFGLTRLADGFVPGYADWVQLVVDYLAAQRDGRPVVLFGLSAGGMLTYHVAAAAPAGTVAGIVGMTFLDQRVPHVARATAHDVVTGAVGPAVMRALSHTLLRGMRYPMPLAGKMRALANDPAAMKVLLADRTSAGNAMPLKFLAEYMSYAPAVEPADFDACPILHTQPAADRWTPLPLSTPVLSHISKVPVTTVMLENAGHYPLEEPGLTQLQDAVDGFVREVAASGA